MSVEHQEEGAKTRQRIFFKNNYLYVIKNRAMASPLSLRVTISHGTAHTAPPGFKRQVPGLILGTGQH